MKVNDLTLLSFFPFENNHLENFLYVLHKCFCQTILQLRKYPFILKVLLFSFVLKQEIDVKLYQIPFKYYLRCHMTFLTLSICIMYQHTPNGSPKKEKKEYLKK